jgi:lipopolysaccharide transport system ATP-binding protein
MSTVIEVDDVWKKYRLGVIGTGTLRHDFERWWHRVRGKPDPHATVEEAANRRTEVAVSAKSYSPNGAAELGDDEVWALRRVSFEVKQGEILGIIGRNGAGKSTLLKIFSRVTSPTKGEVRIKGRTASLLEVGTGFHPELTGRENIFLNGAILGMTKAEIRTKLDEIVAFAEIDTYVDTPVKRYSSGMYVRLAFAVAAHLDPEILIVDEVLAVGDRQFQQKCIGKMRDVSKVGRTVLFVSHNMNAITALCSKVIVLKRGDVIFNGKVEESLQYYGASSSVSGSVDLASKKPGAYLQSLSIIQNGNSSSGILKADDKIDLVFSLKVSKPLPRIKLAVAFTSMKGERVFVVGNWLGPGQMPVLRQNTAVTIRFQMPPIIPGRYTLDIGFCDTEAGVDEEFYSAGAVEVAETNYLKMVEPVIPEIGQILVRSEIFTTGSPILSRADK